jgi:hypothetical protein
MNKFQVLKGLTVMLGALVLFAGCNIEADREAKKEAAQKEAQKNEAKEGVRTERSPTERH